MRLLQTSITGTAALIVGLAGCTSSSSPSTATSKNPSPTPARAITVASATEVSTIDPAQACDDTSYLAVQQLYDELVQTAVVGNHTDPSHIVPMLATGWTVTHGGTQYNFSLRKNVTFVNGDPLTSADVVFSLKRDLAKDGCGGYIVSGGLTNNITKILATGKYTVAVTLRRPDPVFLLDLTRQVGIIDHALLDAHGGLSHAGDEWLASHDAGSGPYRLQSYEPDSLVTFAARSNYWAGPPANSSVTLRIVPDASSLQLLTSGGSVDLALGLPLSSLSRVAGNPALQVFGEPSLSYINVGFNTSKPPLNNLKFRQALSYATPVQQLVSAFGAGHAHSWTGPLLPGQLFYKPINSPYSYDLAKAKALLAASGEPNRSITLVLASGENTEQDIATVLQSSWKSIGVQLHIKTMGESAFMNTLNKFQDQLYMITDRANPDPGFYFGYFLTCHNAFNWSQYCNPQVNQLLSQARFSTNAATRAADYQQVQQIVTPAAPYLNLFDLDQVFIIKHGLQGVTFYTDVVPRLDTLHY